MERRNFNPGTLHAPLPAVMATVGDMENANIITVAWTGILSSDPARTYISVRPTRHTYKILMETGEFVINLTTEALAFATDFAGIYTGAKVDKFEKLGLTKLASKEVSAPTIGESPLALECRVFEVLHMGTHDVFMADIVNVSCDESLLDEKGRICFEKAGLIAYAHGEYFALGEKVGGFGFSAAKTEKAKRYAERSKRILNAKRDAPIRNSGNAQKGDKSKPKAQNHRTGAVKAQKNGGKSAK